MFSGQGSHYYQMGKALYEENPVFRRWMQDADAIYQDQVGLSIINELYHS
jgi:acyl transferase domain-containing protein